MNFVEEMDQFLVGRIAFPTVNYVLNRKDILGRYRKLLLTEHYSKDALRELQFQKLSAVLRHAYPIAPEKRGGLNGSMQHLLKISLKESRTLISFAGANVKQNKSPV